MAEKKKKTAAALTPTTFPQWMQLAEMMAESELVPKDFKKKPGDCLVAMQMGASVGLNPFQAIQSIAVINGRPCMWGDAVLGIVMASGLCEDINETDDGTAATCTVKRKGKPTPVVRTFSMEMAKAAKVWAPGRDNAPGKWISLSERPGPWQSYPERMRQMRARSWALRDAFPDVLKGLAIREEVEDYSDPEPGEPKNITPRTPEDMAAELMPRERVSAPVAAGPALEALAEVKVDRDAGSATETGGLQSPAAPVVVEGRDPQPSAEAMMRKTDAVIIDAMSGHAPRQAAPIQESAPSTECEHAAILNTEPEGLGPKITASNPFGERAPGQEALPPTATPKTVFTVGAQRFETNGINRGQMMELFKLYPRVAKKYGQEKAGAVLKNEFHLEHRADLTEEQAERYTIRLKEMLEG